MLHFPIRPHLKHTLGAHTAGTSREGGAAPLRPTCGPTTPPGAAWPLWPLRGQQGGRKGQGEAQQSPSPGRAPGGLTEGTGRAGSGEGRAPAGSLCPWREAWAAPGSQENPVQEAAVAVRQGRLLCPLSTGL